MGVVRFAASLSTIRVLDETGVIKTLTVEGGYAGGYRHTVVSPTAGVFVCGRCAGGDAADCDETEYADGASRRRV